MSFTLPRTAAAFDAAIGLALTEHFQMAYVTNDIERSKALFIERLGIANWRTLAGQMPSGGHIHVELAWVGSLMYELIQADGPGSELYMDRLPAGDGFAMRHHHLGYLIPDAGQWDALFATAELQSWTVAHRNHTPGFMHSCFIDAPELGHYLEFLFPEPAGLAFFRNVPRQGGSA